MIKKMGIRWNLRKLMAAADMFQTTDLGPLLAERGIHLSREQVFRLVTQPPQRLSMDTLAALCDILGCQPNDLIEIEVVNEEVRKTVGEAPGSPRRKPVWRPRRRPSPATSRRPCRRLASRRPGLPWRRRSRSRCAGPR